MLAGTVLTRTVQRFLAADYPIDPAHSSVNFRIDHNGFSSIWGRVNEGSGTISFDPADPESASINLVIQADSVDTNHADRNNHLRSPDFFNTANVAGDLTMMGVTKEVVFATTFNQVGGFSWAPDTEVVGFSASGTVDRTEFGMMFGVGGLGSEVQVNFEVEAN